MPRGYDVEKSLIYLLNALSEDVLRCGLSNQRIDWATAPVADHP
jgi:hypothetical protein